MYAHRYNGGKDKGNDRAYIEFCTIESCINRMAISKWDLENYAQFAEKNKRDFVAAAEQLLKLSNDLIAYCKKPDGTRYDLEKIRTAQFEYNESARKVHSELLGIKK